MTLSSQPLLSPLQSSRPPLYVSSLRSQDGRSLAQLYREPEGEVLRFPGTADFRIGRDRIESHLTPPDGGLAEIRLLGPVMAYWLELQGRLTLHASAVAEGRLAVAFLSRQGGGKSGLAAGLVRAGAALLTDDVLALEETEAGWVARPSYPQMRMWPDEAAVFAGDLEGLPRVQPRTEKRRVDVGPGGFGSFLDASVPLSCLYLAARRPEANGGVEIHPVPRSEALIELVRHSFSPRLVEAAGLQPARLDRLARLVRSVPVRRLVYPSGFDRLSEVAAAVLRDSLPASA